MSSIQSDVSRRKIIRIKISKACNQTISLSLEDLINLQREYDIISEKCLAASPDDYEEQKSKDDLYKQKISALISLEQTKNTLSAISIIDEEIEDFLNIPNTVQASTPNTSFESSKIEIMLNEVRRISSAANSLGAAYVSRSNSLVKEVLWRCGRQLREKLAHVESFVQLVAKLEKLYKSALCLDTFERRDSVRPTTVAAAFSVCCIFCNGSHASADCSSSVSTEEKRRIILARRLCFKCISPGHLSSSCPHALSIRCSICHCNHPTVLHKVRLIENPNNRFNYPSSYQSSSLPLPSAPSSFPSSSSSVTQSSSLLSSLPSSSSSTIPPLSLNRSEISAAAASLRSLSSTVASISVYPFSSADPIDPSESSESSVTTIPDRTLVARYDGAASTSTTSERPAFLINLNGSKCMVWIDTCSPYTLIRENLVDKFNCFPDNPICLSGFAGGSVIWSKEKVSVNLRLDKISVTIDAYVISVLSYCDLIIGTDMLHRITKIGPSKSLKWKLKFGDIYYGSVASSKEIDNNNFNKVNVEEEVVNRFASPISDAYFRRTLSGVSYMDNLLFEPNVKKDRFLKHIPDTSASVYSNLGFSNPANIFYRSLSVSKFFGVKPCFFKSNRDDQLSSAIVTFRDNPFLRCLTLLWRAKLLNYHYKIVPPSN
uniref:Uncharacterized protein LOC113789464 n=1 Tax=Dermatophagoides pteronyssinus TaxID=6956 RepID=A0A6P6XPR8_DERPT|nr:uncharacterized protein LOC113789464 [Dermatophagoides pteronyssinus]